MKRVLTVTLVAALALFAGSAYANFCARDVVPATTLLVPYVIVSMDAAGANPDPAGYTTYLSVTNVSADAQIIHINIWDAESNGILDFNQVLSGYDVWSINFADLLSGHWSAFQTELRHKDFVGTGAGRHELFDTQDGKPVVPFEWGPDGRSAYGGLNAPFSASPYGWSTGLPVAEDTAELNGTDNCTMDLLDDATGSQFKDILISDLQSPLYARTHNGCVQASGRQQVTRHLNDWLSGLGDNPIFFYVTVDVFNECQLKFPDEAGYFADASHTGLVKYANVLIGEIYWVNGANGFSEATPAVHVESDLNARLWNPATYPPNGLDDEFYYQKALTGAGSGFAGTYLEPLATAFGFRYFNDAPTVTSSVILWKNQTEIIRVQINPGQTPPRYEYRVWDCGAYLYYAWDMDEHVITRAKQCPVSPCGGADIDPNEFPFETQMVGINTNNFDLPDKYGWMLIVLPPSYGFHAPFNIYGDPTPTATNDLLNFPYEGWVGVRIEYGHFSAGLEAATMANAHCFYEQQLTATQSLGTNYNYTDGNHGITPWW